MKNRINKLLFLLFIFIALQLFSSCLSTSSKPELEKYTQKLENLTSEELLSRMTLEEKVAQLFVIIPEQLDDIYQKRINEKKSIKGRRKLTKQMRKTFHEYPVGGFCLFARNIRNENQLKNFIIDLKCNTLIRPIIAVDEEGGRVARLARNPSLGIENPGPMEELGKSGDTEKVLKAGQYIGGYLREYGFNFDFAPVADINTNPENIVIGDRSFGSSPELVASMDQAFLSGLHSQNIKGCLKHFPGHGDTFGDTHKDYVAVTKTWDEILDCELIPFIKNFENTDSIMTAHITFTNVDETYPSSLSKKLISDKLRGELGYKGIIITDSLMMGAIEKNYGSSEAAVLAFEAGNDILLMPYDFFTAYNGLLKAVKSGRISMQRLDESVLRILKLKNY